MNKEGLRRIRVYSSLEPLTVAYDGYYIGLNNHEIVVATEDGWLKQVSFKFVQFI